MIYINSRHGKIVYISENQRDFPSHFMPPACSSGNKSDFNNISSSKMNHTSYDCRTDNIPLLSVKRNIRIYAIVFSLLFVLPLQASQLAEVALISRSDLDRLLRGGFDITCVSGGNMAEVVLHNETDVELLNETGLHYMITNRNIEAFLADRLGGRRDDMGGYRTYDEIVEEMASIHDDFPDIAGELVSIGETIEERDIWAFKISDHPEEDEDEPEILYSSLIHSREVITAEVLFNYIYYLVDNYGRDEAVTELVDTRQLWFILCNNPDGYVKNEEDHPDGGGMWRKNCRRNDDGDIIGVDLNRNFGYMWGYDNIGSSPDEGRDTYRGTGPFSEPESQAVREFVNDHNFGISMYFHSWGDLVLYPL
ncbi:MAG TPA: hypothetical protein ENL08_05645, partial [Bacteroidetes bacterium]|nr:hypothetical protein [Bacteroidota bacterium]